MPKKPAKIRAKGTPAIIHLAFTPESEGTQQLYWRGDRWYCSFRIPGERVPHRITMGTADEAEARRKAQSEFIRLQARLSSGKPRREVTFRFVAKKLVAELEAELEARKKYGERSPNGDRLRHPHTITKKINQICSYLVPFFGDKEIRDISDADVRNAKTFFATYWTDGPGKDIKSYFVMKKGVMREINRRPLGVSNRNTVNTYVMTLNEILKYAKTHFQTPHRLTKTAYADRDDSFRLSITPEQYAHLFSVQEDRIRKEKRDNQKWRMRRILLAFEWVLHSGLRVAELNALKYGDIKVIPISGGTTLQLHNVTSKLKPIRTVVCRHEIMNSYEMLKERRKTDDPNEFVFANEFDPLKPCSLIDGCQVLLKKSGLWEDGKGGYRTLGSMRHAYCQTMIHNMMPFNLFKLASNMGTSEKQIRRHYAADINLREDAEALSGTVDVGLVNVFQNAGSISKKDEQNADAQYLISQWDADFEGWELNSDEWMASEIREYFGEYTLNKNEVNNLIGVIRKLRST